MIILQAFIIWIMIFTISCFMGILFGDVSIKEVLIISAKLATAIFGLATVLIGGIYLISIIGGC